MYELPQYQVLIDRLKEPRRFIQVILGPRQVGKTTMIKHVVKNLDVPYLFYSADTVPKNQTEWIGECWDTARRLLRVEKAPEYVLVFDEIQKLERWSEYVKKEWDSDSFNDIPIKVVLLGSSRVLLETGLSDSMMGRYEEIRMGHWTYRDMHEAFGFSLEEYIYYGGYPGSATLIHTPERWEKYVVGSIIDATINKDILVDSPVYKPALLRQTFELAATYSAEILSLTKMIGQLQDAGNVTTIANYLHLLDQSGLISPLYKYAVDTARQRQSPPKLQVYNNALMTAMCRYTFTDAVANPKVWGRIYESAIGAHILNSAFINNFNVYYWRHKNMEVDFVINKKGRLGAFEVKSNKEADTKGLKEFGIRYSPDAAMIVGPNGIPTERFLQINPLDLL